MKSIFLAALAAFLFAACAAAQTGVSGSGGGGAMAIHYHGGWSVGTLATENFDVKDSAADANGYVNSFYAQGGELIATSTAGFNYYGGGFEVVPTKTLAALIKGTNIPADSFRVFAGGTVGEFQPNAGAAFFTGSVHAGFRVALTSSGSVTWDTVQVAWMNPGVLTLSTQLAAYFGGGATGTAQSPKAAKMRRALARLRLAK